MGMVIAKDIRTFLLLRKDDVPSAESKKKVDAHSLLQELSDELCGRSFSDGRIRFERAFFVLGRSSQVLIASGRTLQDIPEMISIVNEAHDRHCTDIEKSSNSRLNGSFECFAFPSVSFLADRSEPVHNGEASMPVVFFVRTPVKFSKVIQVIESSSRIASHIKDACLGLGIYDFIFYMKFNDLPTLRDSISELRNRIGSVWETSTLIGVAYSENETAEDTSEPPCHFSISLRCRNNIVTERTVSEILALVTSNQYSHMFSDVKKEEVLTQRQGYMDLEIACKSKQISRVFKLICDLRRIEEIIDTATVVHIQIV